MDAEQEYTIDRTGWASGAWDGEPDRVEWRSHGFPCLIVRSQSQGALCGYVGVPSSHPWHGGNRVHDFDGDQGEVTERKIEDVEVHGGLTYSNECCPPICHVPKPGESDDVWWLGFDCAHAFDVAPAREAFERRLDLPVFYTSETAYRDLAYVRAQVESLASQAAAVTP